MITNSIKNVHARQRVDQLLQNGEIESAVCEHLEQIHDVLASASGCEDCLKIGDPWMNLRICLTCGHVGCCDSSKNKHATKHFHSTAHPIIQSFNPGESWIYCYVDDSLVTE